VGQIKRDPAAAYIFARRAFIKLNNFERCKLHTAISDTMSSLS